MLQDPSPQSAAPPHRRWFRCYLRYWRLAAIVVVVVLIGIGLYAIHRGAEGYYVFAPGTAPVLTTDAACKGNSELKLPSGEPCVRIQVPAALAANLSNQLFMVDVSVGPATSLDYVLGKIGLLNHVRHGAVLVPADEYTGGESPSEVACSSVAQMSGAQEAAPVAALRRLGYTVTEVDKGAAVGLIVGGSPAAKAGMHCNQVITAINGAPVRTDTDLLDQIRKHKVGDTVTVTATNPDGSGTVHLPITLTPTPAATAAAQKEAVDTPFLGVGNIVTDVTYRLPVDVTIEAGDIGGPSAGLAFTLAIIDLLAGGHLTGSAKVAATGEIEANGTVDAIGGVAQKAVAVERAGAKVFLVPQANYADARKAAGSKLKVEPVTNLEQALTYLGSIGGTVPPANFAQSHPVPAADGATVS